MLSGEASVAMTTSWSLRLPFLVFLLLVRHACGEEQQLTYHLAEQQDQGTFVGNLARDSELYKNFTNAEFQQLQYSLSSQGSPHASKFSVEGSSTIRTAAVLDREEECPSRREECRLNFDVGVYMRPLGSGSLDLIKIIHVVIILDDINDNDPKFPKPVVTLTVPESVSADSVLLTSGAVDWDAGNNSIQEYAMEPPSSMFGLRVISNPDGSSDLGIVVLHSLDRETRDHFQVRVVARDGGYPRRSGSIIININVTDVNDNRPLFVNTTFRVTVREDVPVNSTILTLSANDPDEGDNGKMNFFISTRASTKVRETLGVRQDTGELFLQKALDFEDNGDVPLQFFVEVRDQGTPPLSSQAEVVLTIADVNDNAPQINVNLPPGGSAVPENLEIGAFIAYVNVIDKDGGDNGKLVCSILDPHFILQRFSDTSYIYKILLHESLDYETARSHQINVSCADHGTPPHRNSTSFTLLVNDINDNPPAFTSPIYRVTVPENNAVDASILEFRAIDPDEPGTKKSQVVYFLLQDAMSRFSIDSTTGTIRAATSFDREQTAEYRFHVGARDLGSPSLTSTALVIVEVEDRNDEPSEFASRHFHMNVVEEQNSGVVVGRLNVTDRDSVVGDLRFTIRGPSGIHQYFSVEADTGVIRTAARLDREVRDSYDMEVDLVDRERPEFRDVANVTVSVLDMNDRDPIIVFVNNTDTVSVPVHEGVGYVICRILTDDKDVGRNAQVMLNIEEGNTKSLFFINAAGELIVAKQMRRSDIDAYPLVIAARDGGQPQRHSFAHLTVMVTNSNVTTFSELHDVDQNQNVAIVVTLVVVTLVLSIAVVVTICIIRRIDRERRQQHVHSKTNEHVIGTTETQGADKVPTIVTSRSEPYSTEIDKLKRKIKDDLSFIVDEENETFEDTSTLTQGNSFSTFKNMTSYSSLDRQVMAPPRASSSVLQRSDPQSSETQLKSTGSPCLEVGHVDPKRQSSRNLNHPGGHLHPDSPPKSAHTKKGILRHLDGEVASQMSEAGDSGRGGSDEDIRSHRGSAHLPSDTEEPKHHLGGLTVLTFHAERVCRLVPGEAHHHSDNPHLFAHPQMGSTPCSLNLPRNISLSDDSATANTTVDLRSRAATPNSLGGSSILATTTPRTPKNPPRLPPRGTIPYTDTRRYRGSDASYRGTFLAGTPGRRALPGNETNRSGGYSLTDLDDALTEETMTNVTRDDEEDRTTTTSGSYTINADELCNEIDHLFFRDVIV